MNSTFQVVLITIVSIHLLNFIALFIAFVLGNGVGSRYEYYAKRFCFLSVYLVLFVFVLFPMSIVDKLKERIRRNDQGSEKV